MIKATKVRAGLYEINGAWGYMVITKLGNKEWLWQTVIVLA